MTPRHYVLTLTGVAQSLAEVLPDALVNLATPGVPASGIDRPSKKFNSWVCIWLQAGANNANPVYLGDADVSVTDYGVRIPAAAAGIPSAPFALGPFMTGKLMLDSYWVLGTDTEKLHILAIEN